VAFTWTPFIHLVSEIKLKTKINSN